MFQAGIKSVLRHELLWVLQGFCTYYLF